ncbi:MAG: Rossmann-like and DUF2520 domain-containing protein [Paludibacteraceae bacterium]
MESLLMDAPKTNIVFVGAGNLATNLACALQAKHCIMQVFSRTEASAQQLAYKLGVPYTTRLADIRSDADLYIYALTDEALPVVINNMPHTNGIHVHTAGSMPMHIFADKQTNYGVFYPFQTFSKQKRVDFATIPIFIEANNSQTLDLLSNIAKTISQNVYFSSSEDRTYLHLSGVFANNFTNYFYSIAAELLAERRLPFEVLLPLINESVGKLATLSPFEAQTGPAVRGDHSVVSDHLHLLSDHPAWAHLYKTLSEAIEQQHSTKHQI